MNAIKELFSREGGKRGLGQTANTGRMTAVITAPFAIGWLIIQILVPEEYVDLSILLFFTGWIAYILVLYAQMKAKAASFVVFPQSHWFFPDGQQINFDLMLPPKSWEHLFTYKDGSTLWRVLFKDAYLYKEEDRPEPDVFNSALWKLPSGWNESFARNGHGEFFCENMFVDLPNTENIEVSVVDWQERGAFRLPLCVITGCSWFFKQALGEKGKARINEVKNKKKPLTGLQKAEAKVLNLQNENRELLSRNEFLEAENEHYANEKPENIKRLTDKRLESIRKKYSNIMQTKQSLWSRFTNLKTFGLLMVLICVILLATHYWLGFP
jgi:hypothetical protein